MYGQDTTGSDYITEAKICQGNVRDEYIGNTKEL